LREEDRTWKNYNGIKRMMDVEVEYVASV